MFPPHWRFTCGFSSSSKQKVQNLVNRSVQRITEVYREVDRRLKSTSEKEVFRRNMASNREERDLEDTHESAHITLEQYMY